MTTPNYLATGGVISGDYRYELTRDWADGPECTFVMLNPSTADAHADDDGRFLGSIASINGAVFPNDDLHPAKVRAWLAEIVATGMVHLYTASGVQYGCFPSWHKHQVINRYTPSVLPTPGVECAPRRRKGGDEE